MAPQQLPAWMVSVHHGHSGQLPWGRAGVTVSEGCQARDTRSQENPDTPNSAVQEQLHCLVPPRTHTQTLQRGVHWRCLHTLQHVWERCMCVHASQPVCTR